MIRSGLPVDAVLPQIADAAHAEGLTVWTYTGWTFEDLLAGKAGEKALEALEHIDVLVDGPFVEALCSRDCLFRGSSNQRLVNVPASLASRCAIEISI
jgi:anaerobic ribonucleoside-triphosphate reductase activating protein